MDEVEVKSVTNDIVSVINESHENTVEEDNKDNAVNVSVKKGVMDEVENKNENSEVLPIENGDVVENGISTEHNNPPLETDETKEKGEAETMEKVATESLNCESNENNPGSTDGLTNDSQPSEPIESESLAPCCNEPIDIEKEVAPLQEPIDENMEEKQDLPERTDKEADIEPQAPSEETVDTSLLDDKVISGENIEEERVEVVAEEIKIEEPEAEKSSNDNEEIAIEGDAIIQTSMVSHMVSTQVDSEQPAVEDIEERVSNEEELTPDNEQKDTGNEPCVTQETPETNTQEIIESSNVVDEPTESNAAEQDAPCTSMVAHIVAPSSEAKECEKIESCDNDVPNEAPKVDIVESSPTENTEVENTEESNMENIESQVKDDVPVEPVPQTEENKDINEEEVESVAPTAPEVDKIEDEAPQVDTKNLQEESASEVPAENPTGESCDTTSMVSHMVQQTNVESGTSPITSEDNENKVFESDTVVENKQDEVLEKEEPKVVVTESSPEAEEVQQENQAVELSDNQTSDCTNTTSMVSHMVNIPSEQTSDTNESKENVENMPAVEPEIIESSSSEIATSNEMEADVAAQDSEIKVEDTNIEISDSNADNVVELEKVNQEAIQEASIPVIENIETKMEETVETSPIVEIPDSSQKEEEIAAINLQENIVEESCISENAESTEAQLCNEKEEKAVDIEPERENTQDNSVVTDASPASIQDDQKEKEEEDNEQFEIVDASMCCEDNSETKPKLDAETNINSTVEQDTSSSEDKHERIIAIEVENKSSEEVIESPSEPEMIIPVKQESPNNDTNEDKDDTRHIDENSDAQTLESPAKSTETEKVDEDEGTKVEHSKDETMHCSVEKEIIESEEGAKIERTKTCETQVIRETKKQTTVSETVETLTQEELFEKFPELRGSILNETNETSHSEVIEGGKGTFEDPKTITASQEDSKVTSGTCPEDKDATIITVTSSSLTKQTMQASSSRTSDGKTEEILKGPSPPARKRKESEQEKKSSDVEAAPKEDSTSSPTIVNVPISVEIPNDKPEATVKENESPPPKPVAVAKPPETARNPPVRPANQQQGICCTIL